MRSAFIVKTQYLVSVLKLMSSPIEYRNSMASPPPVYRMDWAAEEIDMFVPANIANMMLSFVCDSIVCC